MMTVTTITTTKTSTITVLKTTTIRTTLTKYWFGIGGTIPSPPVVE